MLAECPRHKPTPLYSLPALAERLGLGEIRVKDESQRFGFGAFKALGGVIAVYNELCRRGRARLGPSSTTFADLMDGKHREITSHIHLRHGELGQPWPLGRRRRQAVRQPLRRLPAEIHQRREGSGDPRPRRRGDPGRRRLRHRRRRMPAQVAGEWLDHHLRHLVGGLRFGAAQRHARLLRAGARGDRRSNGAQAPTHVFVQAGVGGLAAAVIGYLWAVLPERPTFIVVEPTERRLLVPEQRGGQARPGERQCRHGHGRPRLPRDLARHLADRRRGARTGS